MDMGHELHAPAALNRAGTERRLDGDDVVGRGGKEKQTFMFLLETVPICSPYEHA
jgi:hypothetical protein